MNLIQISKSSVLLLLTPYYQVIYILISINISIESISRHKSSNLMADVLQILNYLNEFFQKGPEGISIQNDSSINPHLEQINRFMDEKTSQNFKDYIQQIELNGNSSIGEFAQRIIEKLGLSSTSEIMDYTHNFIETVKENLESIFYLTPMFEKNIYEKINPLLRDLANSYPSQFRNAAAWLLSTQKKLSDFSLSAESIMLIHDELMEVKKNIETINFSDVSSLPDRIVSKIKKLDANEYELYFGDWALKFSLLIESKFKNIFIFLNYLWKVEQGKEVALVKLKNKMIGEIFKVFNMHQNYTNIDRFRIYRNKSFHARVNLIYDEKLENCRIILGKKHKLKVSEFALDFGKAFLFINTFYVLVKIIGITIEVNGKSDFDRYLEEFKKRRQDMK